MPGYSHARAKSSVRGANAVPWLTERFRGVPGRECLISVSFFGREELVGELRQLAHRDAESIGDVAHRRPGWVGVAALDQREQSSRDPGVGAESHLGKAALLAKLMDCLAEGWLWPI
jgi:hypothetical protein